MNFTISQCIFHFNFIGFNLHMKFDQVKNYIWNLCDNILSAIHTNFTWKFSLLLLHGFTWISLFEAIFHVYTHDIVSIKLKLDPLVLSLRLLQKDLTKPYTKVKSGDLSIIHDHNVMLRHKLSSDWLNTHVTEQGFCEIL